MRIGRRIGASKRAVMALIVKIVLGLPVPAPTIVLVVGIGMDVFSEISVGFVSETDPELTEEITARAMRSQSARARNDEAIFRL